MSGCEIYEKWVKAAPSEYFTNLNSYKVFYFVKELEYVHSNQNKKEITALLDTYNGKHFTHENVTLCRLGQMTS